MPDSSLVSFDRQLADSASFLVKSTGSAREIPFQFPPKIVNESNSSLWMEVESWSVEPIKIHKGSSGKKMTVEWEYLATDNTFTGPKIASILRDLKSYFMVFTRELAPIVIFNYTQASFASPQYRFLGVNITYGSEIVISGGEPYPLHSKVQASLNLATNNALGEQDALAKVDQDPLMSVRPEWY